ncbi:MAG: DUF547 domain-containing protein [Opitutaceae bacterium]|jgi:hypothetical protein|nr:DUF547 domain-containing protein [Opitutaceae bacterium]
MNPAKLIRSFGVVLLLLGAGQVAKSDGADHQIFSSVLQEFVKDGLVNYAALRNEKRLDQYLDQLDRTYPAQYATEAERLALWINAYNAYTLKLVADDYPIKSIHDLGTGGRIIGWLLNRSPWDIRFAKVGGEAYTLNEIEHEILRVRFDEPRIHFAIVCAAVSCPPLRAEAYFPDRLDEQLEEQARQFIADVRSNRFDLNSQRAEVSPIFSWFDEDFGENDAEILDYIAKLAPAEVSKSILENPRDWSLGYSHYDWSLNDQP